VDGHVVALYLNAMRKQLLLLPVICGILVGPAQAESTLDRYLKKNSEAGSAAKPQADIVGVQKVYKSAEGYWRLDHTRTVGGFCAITYVAGAYSAGYLGSSPGSVDSYIVFIGPTIPPAKKVVRKKMTLTAASDGQISSVTAYHGPNAQAPGAGIVSFRLTSIGEAIDMISDVEELAVSMDGKRVFSIKWSGGHTARSAMQACLGGDAPATGSKR
jgi:hypothetical protein